MGGERANAWVSERSECLYQAFARIDIQSLEVISIATDLSCDSICHDEKRDVVGLTYRSLSGKEWKQFEMYICL